MAASEVLREYLISLGIKVDQRETRKLENTLTGIGIKASLASSAIKSVATTVAEMAEQYVESMEKMYYASRHANTSILGLKAIAFAGKMVGVETAAGVEAVTQALRDTGKVGRMSNILGRIVDPTKEKPDELLLDLVQALSKTFGGDHQHVQAIQMRQLLAESLGFGQNFQDLEKNIQPLIEQRDAYKEMAEQANVTKDDMQRLGESSHRLMMGFRRLEAGLDLVIDGVLTNFMPLVDWISNKLNHLTVSDRKAPLVGVPWNVTSPELNKVTNDAALKAYQWTRYRLNGIGHPQGWAEAHGIFPPGGDTQTAAAPSQSANDPHFKTEAQMKQAAMLDPYERQREDAQDATQDNLDAIAKEIRNLDREKDPDRRARKRAILEEQLDSAMSYAGPKYASFSGVLGGQTGTPGGGTVVNMNQTNHLIIQGGDADKISQGVGSAIDKSNGNLLRDAKGGLQ